MVTLLGNFGLWPLLINLIFLPHEYILKYWARLLDMNVVLYLTFEVTYCWFPYQFRNERLFNNTWKIATQAWQVCVHYLDFQHSTFSTSVLQHKSNIKQLSLPKQVQPIHSLLIITYGGFKAGEGAFGGVTQLNSLTLVAWIGWLFQPK